MRFVAVSALLGLLAVQQAAAVSVLLPPSKKRRAISNFIVGREEAIRIGNVLLVSLFAQNRATSAPTIRRVASVALRIRSQPLVLVPAFREWVSLMQITAP